MLHPSKNIVKYSLKYNVSNINSILSNSFLMLDVTTFSEFPECKSVNYD